MIEIAPPVRPFGAVFFYTGNLSQSPSQGKRSDFDVRVLISPGAGKVNAEVIEVGCALHLIIEDQFHDFGV